MSLRTILLSLLFACAAGLALADHQPTEITWPGWVVQSGEELYASDACQFPKYPLTHLFDGDPKRCWVYSGKLNPKADSPKPSPHLVLVPEWPVKVDGIGIINGYAKSEKLYRRNDRASRLRVTINGDDHGLLPAGASKTVHEAKLADTLTMQKIAFRQQKVFCLRIDITEVASGEVHDLCISELALFCNGKKIDMHMPEVVRYTPGDDCGCGTTYTMIRRSGKTLFGGSGGDVGDFAAWDATGRFLADIATTDGQDFTLVIVDALTGREIHRHHGRGEVASIEWAGRRMTLKFAAKGKHSLAFTAPAPTDGKPTFQPEHPNYEDWQDEWAYGSYVVAPPGADPKGRQILLWPWKLPEDLTQRWAKQQKVAGLTPRQIEQKFGRPASIVNNGLDGASLHVYADFSVGFHDGKCDSWAPRSPNYEKWFAQPSQGKP